jgi:hypothetical protein
MVATMPDAWRERLKRGELTVEEIEAVLDQMSGIGGDYVWLCRVRFIALERGLAPDRPVSEKVTTDELKTDDDFPERQEDLNAGLRH